MSRKLVCRKCGGKHLTIKCGKEKKKNIFEEKTKKNSYKKKNYDRKKRNNFTKVKISNLPNDITVKELKNLIEEDEWGDIGRVKVLTYDTTTLAYVDFYYRNEAEYFEKCIDRTKNIDYNCKQLLEVKVLDN